MTIHNTPALDAAEEAATPAAPAKAKAPAVSDAPQGIVLYTDGGVRPKNPGPGGWGAHGFLYRQEKPKRGSGNSDHLLTTRGYVTKAKAAAQPHVYEEVTPVHYIDGFGSFGTPITNNVAELAGAIAGLQHALDYDITQVRVITDSEYVRKGFESWADSWRRNNWMRQDGTEVINKGFWVLLLEARDQLRARGVAVEIEWIKGHNDFLGNVQADVLATLAVMASQRGRVAQSITVSAPEGYWKYESERHALLHHRRLYFNTQTAFNRPGEYYVGEHGKDDELMGKRVSDGAYGIVRLATPDPVIEMVRAHQISLSGEIDALVMLRLDQLFHAATHQQLAQHETLALMQPDPYRLDLTTLADEPISRELKPPRIAMRAVEAIDQLAVRLYAYETQDPSITVTDLTPILYETTLKSGKKSESATAVMKLKADYNVGFAALPVEARYLADAGVATASVILTLGIDLPDRNSLKRLEGANPVVSLISWSEAPNAFRYATVIEAAGDKGVYCGFYSNLRIVEAAPAKATPSLLAQVA